MKLLYLVGALLIIAVLYEANRKLGLLLAFITILSMYVYYRANGSKIK